MEGGLLINTRPLRDLQIDPVERTARVGAGVKWRSVLEASVPHGLVGLHGSRTDVGVVGYTLGGGLPVLGRAHGSAADHVRSIEVVTADGALRRIDAGAEAELFTLMRGGKGNRSPRPSPHPTAGSWLRWLPTPRDTRWSTSMASLAMKLTGPGHGRPQSTNG